MNKTRNNMPTTFSELWDEYGTTSVPVTLCNNTTAETFNSPDHGVVYVIRLHGHAIVELNDNAVRVRDCGYVTTTTYDRMHRFMPDGWSCNQKQGVGYVRNERGLCWEVDMFDWSPWLYPDGYHQGS